MPTLKQLQDKARQLTEQQKSLVENDKPWSENVEEFTRLETDVKGTLEQIAAHKSVDDAQAKLKGEDAGGDNRPDPAAPSERKSIGRQVVESEMFRKNALGQKGSRFSSGAIELKDFVLGTPASPGNARGGLENQYLPGVVDIQFKPLTVRQLFAQGTMANASVTYLVEKTATNGADAVAEGGLKPASDLSLDQVTEAAKKIATILKGSDEALEDVEFAASYIDGRLRLFVEQKEEDELLNGPGTGAHLTGIMNRSGLAPALARGTDSIPDALFKQMTAIRTTAFVDPTAAILSHTDWQTVRLSKDANGQYLAGGPWGQAYGNAAPITPTLWGVPVVATPAMAAGTALVGAFRTAAQVLQRSNLTVEVTNTDQDDFIHNRVTWRAEERLALAVYRPGAFGKVTGLNAA